MRRRIRIECQIMKKVYFPAVECSASLISECTEQGIALHWSEPDWIEMNETILCSKVGNCTCLQQNWQLPDIQQRGGKKKKKKKKNCSSFELRSQSPKTTSSLWQQVGGRHGNSELSVECALMRAGLEVLRLRRGERPAHFCCWVHVCVCITESWGHLCICVCVSAVWVCQKSMHLSTGLQINQLKGKGKSLWAT